MRPHSAIEVTERIVALALSVCNSLDDIQSVFQRWQRGQQRHDNGDVWSGAPFCRILCALQATDEAKPMANEGDKINKKPCTATVWQPNDVEIVHFLVLRGFPLQHEADLDTRGTAPENRPSLSRANIVMPLTVFPGLNFLMQSPAIMMCIMCPECT